MIEGGISETTRLLECKFDHIFFTGSTKVGMFFFYNCSFMIHFLKFFILLLFAMGCKYSKGGVDTRYVCTSCFTLASRGWLGRSDKYLKTTRSPTYIYASLQYITHSDEQFPRS